MDIESVLFDVILSEFLPNTIVMKWCFPPSKAPLVCVERTPALSPSRFPATFSLQTADQSEPKGLRDEGGIILCTARVGLLH